MTSPAIEIAALTKIYGNRAALDAIDLSVPEGSVLRISRPKWLR